MTQMDIKIEDQYEPEIATFLEEQLYAFNVRATGIADGRMFHALVRDKAGQVIAGINGHTWGGCGEIKEVWVAQAYRGQGLGRQLVQAAEQAAIERGCQQMLLATHSFQAPGFYEKLGYGRLATVVDYPQGHQQIFYVKQLTAERDVNDV